MLYVIYIALMSSIDERTQQRRIRTFPRWRLSRLLSHIESPRRLRCIASSGQQMMHPKRKSYNAGLSIERSDLKTKVRAHTGDKACTAGWYRDTGFPRWRFSGSLLLLRAASRPAVLNAHLKIPFRILTSSRTYRSPLSLMTA